jgi:hypothetical protein
MLTFLSYYCAHNFFKYMVVYVMWKRKKYCDMKNSLQLHSLDGMSVINSCVIVGMTTL